MIFTANQFFKKAFVSISFVLVAFAAGAQNSSPSVSPNRFIPTEKPDCVNVLSPGMIDGDQTVQPGQIPEMIGETIAPEGGSGDLRYLWMEYLQIGSFPAQWYPILSATSANYQPGPQTKTRQYMRCVSRDGCNTYLQSNVVTITVAETAF